MYHNLWVMASVMASDSFNNYTNTFTNQSFLLMNTHQLSCYHYIWHVTALNVSSGNGKTTFGKVTLTNKQTFVGGDTVIFVNPMINVGNAYSTDFGFFAPPVNGTYSFSSQLCSYPGSWIVFGLMKNSEIMDETFAGDTDWHQCGTSSAVIYTTTNG